MSQAWRLFLFLFDSSKFFNFFLVSCTWFFLRLKFFVVIFYGSYGSNSFFPIFNVGVVLSLSFIINFKIVLRLNHNFIFWISIWWTFYYFNTAVWFFFFNILLVNNDGVILLEIFKNFIFLFEWALSNFYWFLQNL